MICDTLLNIYSQYLVLGLYFALPILYISFSIKGMQ